MDVILAQLGPRELESHCRDAMKIQLKALQCALNDAVGAAKRAEEVQLASQKLSITLIEDGSELSSVLLTSTWLRDELAQSLERVVECALGTSTAGPRAAPTKSVPTRQAAAIVPPKSGSTPQKKRKGSTQEAEETSAKKSKRSTPTASERPPELPAKSPGAAKNTKSTSALSKALASCTSLTEDLAKKKVCDRVSELKTLVNHFNTAHKNLDRNSIIDQIEALDTLSVVAGMAVSIMQHGKPQMKRHWVQKFRDNIADIQEQFPDSATAFNGYINALSKIISSFPLTIKEGQRLRMRLRKALEEVKGWKDGHYSIADATQNMALVAEALESTCPNWTPRVDKTVRELTALLLQRVVLFKENKKQAKRKQKLQSWLDNMEHAQAASQDAPTPTASKTKTAPKSSKPPEKTHEPSKNTKTARKGSPHVTQKQAKQPCKSNPMLRPSVSRTESSDTEPTQLESHVKVEPSELNQS